MDKPDDIPQDIWDAAVSAYEAMPLMYDDWDETEVVSCIARAILKAKNDALEDAAKIADKRTVGGYYNGTPEWQDGPEIAQEIRNLKHEG